MKLARSTVYVWFNYSTGFSNDEFCSFKNSTKDWSETTKEWHTKYKINMPQVIVQIYKLWEKK